MGPRSTYEIVDDYTLKGITGQPKPTFLNELTSNPGLMIAPSTIGTPAADNAPIGTGPWVYQAGESTPGQVYVYTLRADYWNPEVQGVERVEVYELPDIGARGNALKSGQIDITVFNDPTQIEIADAGFTMVPTPSDVQAFLVMDREGTMVPALASQQVREALSMAIDRAAIAGGLLNNSAVPALQWRADPKHPEYDASLEGIITTDVEGAKALLAEAGFADGFSLQLPFLDSWRLTLEAVQAMWAEIGVNAELVPIPPAEFGPRNTSGEFPIAFLPAPGPDAAVQCSFFFGPAPVNAFKAADTGTLAVLGPTFSTFGDDRRTAVLALEEHILKNFFIIPVVAGIKAAAFTEGVSGVSWTFEDLLPSPVGMRLA
jgi:peptide/nickel transport system substrate-binding protein